MEIAAFVVSVLAALVAVWMAFLARAANQRADEANRQSEEALDHEKRLDDREREFRSVSWRGSLATPPDGPVTFELVNAGLTEARDVVLVVHESHLGEVARFDFERICGGDRKSVDLNYRSDARARREIGWDPAYTVHWASPLGHASRVESPEGSVFFG